MRKLSSILTIFLVLCLTVGGVSAAWVYAIAPDTFDDLFVNLSAGYTITYINEGMVLYKTPVIPFGDPVDANKMQEYNNEAKKQLDDQIAGNPTYDATTFSYWMNAGSTRVDDVPSGNIENIVLYPTFDNLYTASFVDQDGNLLTWCYFTKNDQKELVKQEAIARQMVKDQITDEKLHYDYWYVRYTDGDTSGIAKFYMNEENATFNFTFTGNATIYPYYSYSGAKIEGTDIGGDGDTDHYEVYGYPENTTGLDLVEIPSHINGKPVTLIHANAFESYDDLHAVKIPATIEKIGVETFPGDAGWLGRNREVITIYYEGTPAQWQTLIGNSPSWDEGMGAGSRVFFINSDEKVIDGYYLELNVKSPVIGSETCTWVIHSHSYSHTAKCTSCNSSGTGDVTNYQGSCGCDSCEDAGYTVRPDAKYWPAVTPADGYWTDKIP